MTSKSQLNHQTLESEWIAIYTEMAKRGHNSSGVGQTSRSQLKRFNTLLRIGDLEGKSIVDIGCGFGDFYQFLRQKGVNADYTGYDITSAMLEVARAKHPEIAGRFHLRNVLVEEPSEAFDFALCNGALNLRCDDNLGIMLEMIARMIKMSRVGTAITMTSALTKKPKPDTYYYDPSEILRPVSKLCQNVLLDHSYLPHDFTLFCYKRSLYDD